MAIKDFQPDDALAQKYDCAFHHKGLSKVKPGEEPSSKRSRRPLAATATAASPFAIGGGNKKKYRIIDFKRQKLDVYAEVKDPGV